MNIEANPSQLVGITYSDELPIAWELHTQLPGDGEIHRLNCANEELLQTLLVLDEPTQDNEDETEGAGNEHWRRLEGKLNILLSLVGEMLTADSKLPAANEMQLGVSGLRVEGVTGNAIPTEQLLKIRLYLDPKFPRPLQLFAHVIAVNDDSMTLGYRAIDASVQDLLDKYVFRQHRRAIALARRGENS